MAEVIRVADGDGSFYVPVKFQARLERFAAAGMADISAGAVVLRSDGGPIFWSMMETSISVDHDYRSLALKALGSNSIRLAPDEQIAFGNKDGAEFYSEFADISLSRKDDHDLGIRVAGRPIRDNEVVMTVWPKGKRLIPAKASISERRVWLELAESQEKGERCFVLDEKCANLLTASYESDGGDKVRVIPSVAIDSWLCSVGSRAVMGMSDRYSVETKPGGFAIRDRKSGKTYFGKFISQDDEENRRFELLRMERLLFSKGLGAILPSYQLRKAMGI